MALLRKIDKDDGKGIRDGKKVRESAFRREKTGLLEIEKKWCKTEKFEMIGPHVARDETTITMDGLAQTADVGIRRCLAASFASGLVGILKVSTMNIFQALMRQVVVERGRNILNMKMSLTFLKSGYLMRWYVPANNMSLWITISSERQENMIKKFREYLRVTGLGLLVLRKNILCNIFVAERKAVSC